MANTGWFRSQDGYRIPASGNPLRTKWDKDYEQKVRDYFGHAGVELVPVSVPVNRVSGGHGIMPGHPRTEFYTRLYRRGERVPPVVVSETGTGWYNLLDGNRRHCAAKAAGVSHMPGLLIRKVKSSKMSSTTPHVYMATKSKRLGKSVQEDVVEQVDENFVLDLSKSDREASPELPPRIASAMWALQQSGVLTDAEREGYYRENPNVFVGQSFVASEALYHLIEGAKTGWELCRVERSQGGSHCFLRHKKTGHVLDPTADQLDDEEVPYDQGVPEDTQHPSVRAQRVIERAKAVMQSGPGLMLKSEPIEKRALDPSEGYRISHQPHPAGIEILAHDRAGNQVGRSLMRHHVSGALQPAMTYVDEEHQRKGIASAMYAHAQKVTGKKLVPDDAQTEDAEKLWQTRQWAAPLGKAEQAGGLRFKSPDGLTEEWDYSHMLPEQARRDGYRVHLRTVQGAPGTGALNRMQVFATKTREGRSRPAGQLVGNWSEQALQPWEVFVEEQDRRKRLGQAMYAAMYQHGRTHLGLSEVVGTHHSTADHLVHKKLAMKYGLNYESHPNVGPGRQYSTMEQWRETDPHDYDARYSEFKFQLPKVSEPKPVNMFAEHRLPGSLDAEGYKMNVAHTPEGSVGTIHRHGKVLGHIELGPSGHPFEEWTGEGQREGLKDAALMVLRGHGAGEMQHDEWNGVSRGSQRPLGKAIPESKPTPSVEEGPAQGSHVTQPHANYTEAAAAKPKGQEYGGGKNLWARNHAGKNNADRTLMVQFSSDLLQGGRQRDAADDYYDKLYANREGYHRPADFWEIPQWQAHLSHSMPNTDHYTVRDPEEAIRFLNAAGYKHVAFSALDVNKDFVKRLAEGAPKQHVVVGGYTDMNHFAGLPNVSVHPSIKSFVESEGMSYKPGYDYRHFSGTKTIPRLTLSDGCRHQCTFCCVPKKVDEKSREEILQQADAFAEHLPSDLIYLNDKTFGQAENHAMLPELYQRIKAKNPGFKGFVIQTTAAQMKRFTPDFLKNAGIRHVELGIESVNDPILRAHKKPATEALIEEAANKVRASGASLIPNIMVGLPGEDRTTYQRTLDWLNRHRDIISHVNAYNLALYDDSELGKKLQVISAGDRDENVQQKSWHVDPQAHKDFANRLWQFASGQLDKPVGRESFHKSEPSEVVHLPNGYKIEAHHWGNGRNTTMRAIAPNGEHVGSADLTHNPDGETLYPEQVWVEDAHQRLGLASAMYDVAQASTNKTIERGQTQTVAGQLFRQGRKRGLAKADAPRNRSPFYQQPDPENYLTYQSPMGFHLVEPKGDEQWFDTAPKRDAFLEWHREGTGRQGVGTRELGQVEKNLPPAQSAYYQQPDPENYLTYQSPEGFHVVTPRGNEQRFSTAPERDAYIVGHQKLQARRKNPQPKAGVRDIGLVKAEVDPHEPIASVVVVQDGFGRTLWGRRRKDGKYVMPAGHAEMGETPAACAVRELHEEAGLIPDKLWYIGAGNGVEGPVYVYHCIARGQPTIDLDPDREMASWEWVDCLMGPPEHITANLAHVPNVVYPPMGWEHHLQKSEGHGSPRGGHLFFAGDCTHLDGDLINEMKRGGRFVYAEDFRGQIDPEFEKGFNQYSAVPLYDDAHVGFFESNLPGSGRRALYFSHSGIEHVFTDDGQIHDDEVAAAKE